MKESKVFQLSMAPTPSEQQLQNPPAKKRKTAKRKAAPKRQPEVLAAQNSDGKSVVFLEDVRNAISYTLQGVSDDMIQRDLVWALQGKAVSFGLVGHVDMEKEKDGSSGAAAATVKVRGWTEPPAVTRRLVNCKLSGFRFSRGRRGPLFSRLAPARFPTQALPRRVLALLA
eukprot:2913331-Pyramimonas_sp.AAC.1